MGRRGKPDTECFGPRGAVDPFRHFQSPWDRGTLLGPRAKPLCGMGLVDRFPAVRRAWSTSRLHRAISPPTALSTLSCTIDSSCTILSKPLAMVRLPSSLESLKTALFDSARPADYIPLANSPTEKRPEHSKEIDAFLSPPEPISEPQQPSRLQVIFTVSFHIASALSVTLLNKWALNNVPLPQVLLAFQSGICVVLSIVVKMLGLGNVGHLALPFGEIQKLYVYLFMRTVGVGMKVWCLNVSRTGYRLVTDGSSSPHPSTPSREGCCCRSRCSCPT